MARLNTDPSSGAVKPSAPVPSRAAAKPASTFNPRSGQPFDAILAQAAAQGLPQHQVRGEGAAPKALHAAAGLTSPIRQLFSSAQTVPPAEGPERGEQGGEGDEAADILEAGAFNWDQQCSDDMGAGEQSDEDGGPAAVAARDLEAQGGPGAGLPVADSLAARPEAAGRPVGTLPASGIMAAQLDNLPSSGRAEADGSGAPQQALAAAAQAQLIGRPAQQVPMQPDVTHTQSHLQQEQALQSSGADLSWTEATGTGLEFAAGEQWPAVHAHAHICSQAACAQASPCIISTKTQGYCSWSGLWAGGADEEEVAGKGRLKGTPVMALPPASQLDEAVLDALPLPIKRELERAYGEPQAIFEHALRWPRPCMADAVAGDALAVGGHASRSSVGAWAMLAS